MRCSILVVFAFCGGCAAPTQLQITSCPNPVLLGPVDRIGGHRTGPTKKIDRLKIEVEDWASASSQTAHGITTTTATVGSTGTDKVGLDLVARTEGRKERDIRVRRLPVGAWAWVLAGHAGKNTWAGVDGDIVEVPRDR